MSYNHFYKQLKQNAAALFPGVSPDEIAWDYLVSPLELKLPRAVYRNASAAIRSLYSVSRRTEYQSQLEPQPGISDHPHACQSVLMAYDFHTTENGDCFLVEINTNASGFMFSSLMEMTHSGSAPESHEGLKKLRASFENDLRLWGKALPKPNVAITDEDIEQQKMYPEFVMYRDWFTHMGWRCELCEARDFKTVGARLTTGTGMEVDLVYNRLTDFYLENPDHAHLREGFIHDRACVTPNPREYWLLADKQRLVQLGQIGFLEKARASEEEITAIRKVIIPTFEKSHFAGEDDIWAQRKHLFFKPKRSHGGKSVYRGESVSRKVFERLMGEDILIQNFQPAQKMPTDDPHSPLENWRFDVRFYVYEGDIQMCVARIYQGQVTNFSSAMGGFTLVKFV